MAEEGKQQQQQQGDGRRKDAEGGGDGGGGGAPGIQRAASGSGSRRGSVTGTGAGSGTPSNSPSNPSSKRPPPAPPSSYASAAGGGGRTSAPSNPANPLSTTLTNQFLETSVTGSPKSGDSSLPQQPSTSSNANNSNNTNPFRSSPSAHRTSLTEASDRLATNPVPASAFFGNNKPSSYARRIPTTEGMRQNTVPVKYSSTDHETIRGIAKTMAPAEFGSGHGTGTRSQTYPSGSAMTPAQHALSIAPEAARKLGLEDHLKKEKGRDENTRPGQQRGASGSGDGFVELDDSDNDPDGDGDVDMQLNETVKGFGGRDEKTFTSEPARNYWNAGSGSGMSEENAVNTRENNYGSGPQQTLNYGQSYGGWGTGGSTIQSPSSNSHNNNNMALQVYDPSRVAQYPHPWSDTGTNALPATGWTQTERREGPGMLTPRVVELQKGARNGGLWNNAHWSLNGEILDSKNGEENRLREEMKDEYLATKAGRVGLCAAADKNKSEGGVAAALGSIVATGTAAAVPGAAMDTKETTSPPVSPPLDTETGNELAMTFRPPTAREILDARPSEFAFFAPFTQSWSIIGPFPPPAPEDTTSENVAVSGSVVPTSSSSRLAFAPTECRVDQKASSPLHDLVQGAVQTGHHWLKYDEHSIPPHQYIPFSNQFRLQTSKEKYDRGVLPHKFLLSTMVCSLCGAKLAFSNEGAGCDGILGGKFLENLKRKREKESKELTAEGSSTKHSLALYDSLGLILRMLTDVLWKGETRGLNIGGSRFKRLLPWDNVTEELFRRLEYGTLSQEADGSMRLPPPRIDLSTPEGLMKRNKLLRAWIEIGITLCSGQVKHPELDGGRWPFPKSLVRPASQAVTALLGGNNLKHRPFRTPDESLVVLDSHLVLGTTPELDDTVIEFAYRQQNRTDNPKRTFYLTAIEQIAKSRSSSILENLLVAERSCGAYTQGDLERAYQTLECNPNITSTDEAIWTLFTTKQTMLGDDAAEKSNVLEALTIISEDRGSQVLKSVVASCKPSDVSPPKMSYEKALGTLTGDESGMGADDDMLLVLYEIRVGDSPYSKETARQALEVIAEFRDSRKLRHFLFTGEKLSDEWVAGPQLARADHPVGLDNIANTCYLNSLLQYFFTIRDLREVILACERYEEDDPKDDHLLKRVGGRHVSKREIIRSKRFIVLLQHLFYTLIHTSLPAITPEIELAKLALVPNRDDLGEEDNEPETRNVSAASTDRTLVDEPMADPPTVSVPEPSPSAGLISPSPASAGGSVLGKRRSEYLDTERNVDGENKSEMDVDTSSCASQPRSPKRPSLDEDHEMNELRDETETAVATETLARVDESEQDDATITDTNGVNKDTGKGVAPALPPRRKSVNKRGMTLEQQVSSFMAYGRQNDVSECMDNIMFQIESALDSSKLALAMHGRESLVKSLFYGKTKQELVFEDAAPDETGRHKEEEFFHLLVDVAEEGRDLYEGLGVTFDEDSVEIEGRKAQRRVNLIPDELPPIIQIQLQRVQYDRTKARTFKSNAYMQFGLQLCLDRYLEISADDHEGLERKQRTKELRKELAECRSTLSRLIVTQPKREPVSHYLRGLATNLPLNDSLVEAIDADFLEGLNKEAGLIDEDLAKADQRIKEIKQEMNDIWKSNLSAEYELVSVFIHRGEANFGHYYLHQRVWSEDRKSWRWLKFNDSLITEIPESDVLQDTTGSTANPYWLSFVRKGREDLIEAIKRDPEGS